MTNLLTFPCVSRFLPSLLLALPSLPSLMSQWRRQRCGGGGSSPKDKQERPQNEPQRERERELLMSWMFAHLKVIRTTFRIEILQGVMYRACFCVWMCTEHSWAFDELLPSSSLLPFEQSSHQSPGRWSPKLTHSLTQLLCISIYYHPSTLAQCAASWPCLLRVHRALFFVHYFPANHLCFPKLHFA